MAAALYPKYVKKAQQGTELYFIPVCARCLYNGKMPNAEFLGRYSPCSGTHGYTKCISFLHLHHFTLIKARVELHH